MVHTRVVCAGNVACPVLLVAGGADAFLHANLRDYGQLPHATLHVFSAASNSYVPLPPLPAALMTP